MGKFNLDRALAGAPVVTRDGESVHELVLFRTANTLAGTINGCLSSWATDGRHTGAKDSKLDLFMAPAKFTLWCNVYVDVDARPAVPSVISYESEQEADRRASSGRIGDRAWPLEVEEDQ